MTARGPGGRIPNQNRPSQAPGVGRNAKRHDLEAPSPGRAVPPLHGSSGIQQGDIQALEAGQAMRPPQTQAPAAPQGGGGGGTRPTQQAGIEGVPDAIDFMGQQFGGGGLSVPPPGDEMPTDRLSSWMPFMESLVNSPGSSGLVAGAYINQFRQMLREPVVAETIIVDLNDVDDAIQAMLDEGMFLGGDEFEDDIEGEIVGGTGEGLPTDESGVEPEITAEV